MPVSTQALR
ncbi:hypothetical protein CIB84_000423 [Bambusicola thoracicus]|uniref:Uncharacterized protein n=1 Tax=Bambusicola thoracicus TaxID=9083 RepID=A0A2P4THI0_BAMTH|nr:hypothetical protein CIB84_000423 [Bambusicola thoracicus]